MQFIMRRGISFNCYISIRYRGARYRVCNKTGHTHTWGNYCVCPVYQQNTYLRYLDSLADIGPHRFDGLLGYIRSTWFMSSSWPVPCWSVFALGNVQLVTELQLTRNQRRQQTLKQAQVTRLWSLYRRGEVSATQEYESNGMVRLKCPKFHTVYSGLNDLAFKWFTESTACLDSFLDQWFKKKQRSLPVS